LKVLSCFSGLGAFEKALQRQNIEYELVNYCEIDKYASKSYSLIHNVSEELNLGDITKVNEKELSDFDLLTWGFPCTSISIAGKQQGIIKGETASGLYYEGLRILKEKKPKYSIIENVKNLTGKKFKTQFEQILKDLDESKYNNYWKVLNAKDYGIPQNRERIFIISIRKDIDNNKFEFPIGFDNGIRLKDLLEDNVDEKYYINQDKVDKLIEKLKDKEISNTVRSSGRGSLDRHSWDMVCVDNKILQVGLLDIKGNEQVRRVDSSDGISPTLNSMQGGNRQPKIFEENELIFVCGIDTTEKWINNDKELSRNYKEGYRVYDSEGIACCQKTNGGGLGSNTGLYLENTYRIRKLTPLECMLLMDFDKEDYYKLKENKISNSQIYKMAGNSIVVGVLEEIFKKLFHE